MRLRLPVTVPLILLLAMLASCTSRPGTPDGRLARATPSVSPAVPLDADDFTLPEGPKLANIAINDAPSYLFLFTHTEDQFNHELSEERYWRIGAMVEAIATAYPDLGITWTIEFQGADAETVSDRNSETGLLDYLFSLRDRGLVEFGYHTHHDPTYINRPQNDLSSEPSYDEAYDALWTWITCAKDPAYGGCVEERGGGLEAILEAFGQVKIVTGFGIGSGVQFERSAGSQAVRELVPERLLGFGFPDHGAVVSNRDYTAARDGLLALLTPTGETTSGTFWMDNSIRINDAASLEGVNTGGLSDGPDALAESLEALDGSRSFVLNVGIADKYLYTVESTSPTKWGYVNPESPELPPTLLHPATEREKRYALTQQSLEYLAQTLTGEASRLQFVGADQVVELFTSDDYRDVDDDELERLALWMLHGWDGRPPNWVYDGEDFYSLADAFALLAAALRDAPAAGIVSNVYGPWSAAQVEAGPTDVVVDELRTLLRGDLIHDGRIAETYTVGGRTLSASQVLYALGYLYVLDRNTADAESIRVPATDSAPETLGFLETLGCSGCLDTAWSLKPARFQHLSGD